MAAVLSVGAVSVATLAGLDGSGSTGSDQAGPAASGSPSESRATTLVSRSGGRSSGPSAAPGPTGAVPSQAALPTAPAERTSLLASVPVPDLEEAVPTTTPSVPSTGTASGSDSDAGSTSETSDAPSDDGSGDQSSGGSGGETDDGPTSTLTEAQATARCLASGVSALDEAALADCVDDLLG